MADCENPLWQAFVYLQVVSVQRKLEEMWRQGLATTSERGGDWATHVFRELNTHADEMATAAMTRRTHILEQNRLDPLDHAYLWLRCSFDGGQRGDKAGAGWTIELHTVKHDWEMWKRGAYFIPGASSTQAELTGLRCLMSALWMIANRRNTSDAQDIGPVVEPL